MHSVYCVCLCVGDDSLRKHLDERRNAAEEREARIRESNDVFDDDRIMERIFNSLTGTSNVWHHTDSLDQ